MLDDASWEGFRLQVGEGHCRLPCADFIACQAEAKTEDLGFLEEEETPQG